MTSRRVDTTERPRFGGNVTVRPGGTTERPQDASIDVLSEVLRAVRLRGAVFFSVTGSTPWAAETPHAHEVAPYVMPGAEHVIEFHVITSGSCWGGIIGEPYVRLDPGDVIVFPKGDAHVLGSGDGMRATPNVAEHRHAALARLPIRHDFGGSGRDPVNVICGFLACDSRPFNPLLDALPRVLHMRKRDAAGADILDHFIHCALAESETPRAGGEVVLARLSELMFVEVVRRFVAGLPVAQLGWLAGLRDEQIGRALGLLHARSAHAWTLEDLAREVGSSRSVLAERFVEYVGVPPMQYLAQWRMQLAATMLGGPSTLAKIAEDVGYGSEAALSRAFKKIVGVTPATWRAARAV